MAPIEQARKGEVCYVCGNKGFHEELIACSQCKKANEHFYCTANFPNTVCATWICEACEEENRHPVQLPSRCALFTTKSEDVSATPQPISQKSGCAESDSRCDLQVPSLRINNQSLTSSDETLAHCNEEMIEGSSYVDVCSSPQSIIKTVECKSSVPLSTTCNNGKNPGLCSDIQCMGSDLRGIGLSSTFIKFPNKNEIQWRGRFVISDMGYHIYDDIKAHSPGHISSKAYNASKLMPEKLQFSLIDRLDIWPHIFQLDSPSFDDVALFFLPSEFQRPREKYIRLLERMNKYDLAMCCCLNDFELLIYTSKLLPLDPQNFNRSPYLWGIFRHSKRRKLNQDTRTHGEGNCAEADNKPVAYPAVLKRGQLNDCGSVSDPNSFGINKFSTAFLKLKDDCKEQNVPSVPPGFSKLSLGEGVCRKRPFVEFDLKKHRNHIGLNIPLGFSSPLHLKNGSGSSECTGKSPIPKKREAGGLASFASGRGSIMSSSNTEQVHQRCHQTHNTPLGGAYTATAKLAEPTKTFETEEKVYLDEKRDADEKSMVEDVEHEEIEEEVVGEVAEEVVKVEKEGQSTVINADNPEMTTGHDDEMKDGENEGDESEKHAELLSLPPHGSEVYISNIPQDVSEDVLKSFVEAIGEIAEVRITKAKDSAENKGYAWITYRSQKLASKAIEDLRNKEFKGGKVKVSIYQARHSLFIGNVPKKWVEDDLKEVVMKIGPGVTLVRLIKVKEVYIGNLPRNVTQDKVEELFKHHGEITKVTLPRGKPGQENRFAIVHLAERSMAMKALQNTEKYQLDGDVLECSLAKPPADAKKGKAALLPVPTRVGHGLVSSYGAIPTV